MRKKLILLTKELSRKWIDRMRDEGVDTIGIHPGGASVPAAKRMKDTLETLASDSYRELLDYAAESGLTIEYEMHAGGWLLPREMFSLHPEYFRENAAGERTPDLNFCVSNAEALKIVAERAVELTKKLYRSSPTYYIWMDDVCDGSCCSCEQCRKLSPSDQQMKVMNAIVKRLREEQPEAKLAYLAYFETLTPPRQERPEEGIFLEYAPNHRYLRKEGKAFTPGDRENLRELLEYFGKKDSWVLEYWYDNSLFSRGMKEPRKFSPDAEEIRSEIRIYRELGFENMGSFACRLDEEYERLHGDVDIAGIGGLKDDL